MSDELLREVDADVRTERMIGLWMKYRSTLAMLVVAILLGTAGSTLWQNYQQKRGGEWLARLTDAQALYSKGDFAGAADGFAAMAKDTHGDVADIASIWQARSLVGAGKTDEAVAVLKTTSDHASGLWGDIACLRLAGLAPKEAGCLSATTDSPLAAERHQWAAAHAWESGDTAQATKALEAMAADENSPTHVRDQATQWLTIMNPPKDSK